MRIESAQPCISGVMSLVSGLLARSCSAFSTSPLAMLNSASDEVGWRGGAIGKGAALLERQARRLLVDRRRLRQVLVVGRQPLRDLFRDRADR